MDCFCKDMIYDNHQVRPPVHECGAQVLMMKIIKYMEPSSRSEIKLEFYDYHGVSILVSI